jgi:hypothetical protein
MENFLEDEFSSRGNIFSHKNVRYSDEEDDSESEFEFDEQSDCSDFDDEDDNADNEIREALKEKIQKENDLKQLEGIHVLKPKLNWLEKKENENEKVNENLPNDLFPSLGNKSKSKIAKITKTGGGFLFPPNSSIKVVIGQRTFIEFAPVPCKLFSIGKCEKGEECDYFHPPPPQPCKFAENCKNPNCKFLHEENEIPKNPISKPKQICKFFLAGQKCKFEEKCKFSHETAVVAKKVRALCRNGIDCTNKKCTFFHPSKSEDENSQKLIEKEPVFEEKKLEEKKFVLCRNMFRVSEKLIEKIGDCKFGSKCRFSHSWQEVSDKIKNSDFKCMFEEKYKKCKGVVVEKQEKVIGEQVKSVSRYRNAPVEFKCFKIHKKERVKDYIMRTQSKC